VQDTIFRLASGLDASTASLTEEPNA
jgi:hypothetical protein